MPGLEILKSHKGSSSSLIFNTLKIKVDHGWFCCTIKFRDTKNLTLLMWRLLVIGKKVMSVMSENQSKLANLTNKQVWKKIVKFFVYVVLLFFVRLPNKIGQQFKVLFLIGVGPSNTSLRVRIGSNVHCTGLI